MHPLLVCPNCKGEMTVNDTLIDCAVCHTKFPVVNNIPILLPRESVFSIEQIAASNKTFYADKVIENNQQSLKSNFRKSLPKLTKSWERIKFYEIIN